MNHSPGPWRIGNLVSYDAYTGKPFRNVWADDENHEPFCVARCVDVGPVDDNARLIAASPDLLAACQAHLEGKDWPKAAEMMKAAVAKATCKLDPDSAS